MLNDDEIAGMRDTSESALPATCTITRQQSGGQALNPGTGLLEAAVPVTVWTGPCRVRSMNTQGATGQVGALHESMGRYIVTLPYDATGVEVDDMVTVSAGTDAELIGRPLRVIDLYWSEFQIDRRALVEDLQQPRVTS